MNNLTVKRLLLIIVLAIMPLAAFSQNTNYWFADIDAGGTILKGDNEAFQMNRAKLDLRLGGGYAFSKHFTAYAKLGVGSLSGDKKFLYKVNEANFFTADANISADLISLIGGYKEDRIFALKPHVGIGYIYSKAGATKDEWSAAHMPGSIGKIDSKEGILEVPMGAEFEFNVSRKCSVYADFTWVYANSDYLDGLKSGKHNDWYVVGNVGFRYKFKRAKEEPVEIVEEPVEEPVVEEPAPVEEEPIEEEPIEEEPVEEEPVVEEPAPVVVEPVKPREIVYTDKQIGITYDVGSSEIDVRKAQDAFEAFKKGLSEIDLEKITIKAYSSPEGSAEVNRVLSLERANRAKKYLVEKLGTDAKDITIETSGEGADWDGFMEALKNSNITNKEEFISRINSSSNKIETLRQLGISNPEIKVLYPALRRAEIVLTIKEEK